ncbi:Alpha/Beta hydrolase protein [Xylariaceae sp. FL0016]|nr:Alpha/Beta hydrolase protein [Xylariaceae sp. FL0016]
MAAPTIKKAYVDTPHGQVHYRYALPSHPGKDTLIFLHKSASSSASYERLISHYAPLGHPCYAFDMPGFGSSFDPSPAATAEIAAQGTRWYVDLFMQCFASLGLLGAGLHIIGHHSGASLAVEAAAAYPEPVRSICLVGASVMSAAQRAAMKEKYFAPFNAPVGDGSHLAKTWDYLRSMGVGEDLEVWQREAVDHIRAWKGRNQIYGAIWAQDKEAYFRKVKCPIVAMCARDDVLWPYFENLRQVRDDVEMVEVKGANFTLDRDTEGIIAAWSKLLERASR